MNNDLVSFVIDEQNGVCVAEIKGVDNDVENMLNNRFVSNVTSGFWINNKYNSKYNMNYKYKGIAKLHPDDVWDEACGMKIANDRLTERYHNSVNNRLAKYASDLRKIADNIDKYLADRHFEVNN